MMRSISLVLTYSTLLSTILVFAPMAHAADDTSQRVAELYKEANALYDQKKLTEAEALYLQAWNLKKSYDLACNLGAIELDLSKPRAAAEYLAYALREFPAGGKTSARVQIEGRFKKARDQVGALRVHVSAANAQVVIAGQAVGSSPLVGEVFVEPGSVTVEATLPGYESAKQVVQINKGSAVEVNLTLEHIKRSKLPAFVIGGVGVAALGIGASFIGIAETRRAEAKALSIETNHACPVSDPSPQGKCKDLTAAASSQDTFGNIGIVSLAVGGAAAVGVVTYLLWPASHDQAAAARTMRVLPTASATGGGLFVLGSF
jgi:tetratricopeptide (TPR) repeat protein